jgi:hypothetical protein
MIQICESKLLDFVNTFNKREGVLEHKYLHQYTSIDKIEPTLKDIYNNFSILQKLHYQNCINIGSGPGLMEYVCELNNFNMKTIEVINEPDYEHNQFIRDFFGVSIDYFSSSYNNYDFDINEKFECALVSRFGPFQTYSSKTQIENFLNKVLTITNEIIIPDLLLDKSIKQYLNKHAISTNSFYVVTN